MRHPDRSASRPGALSAEQRYRRFVEPDREELAGERGAIDRDAFTQERCGAHRPPRTGAPGAVQEWMQILSGSWESIRGDLVSIEEIQRLIHEELAPAMRDETSLRLCRLADVG
jgi:hypothetical protein